tara:strand:+ start:4924 stop:5079 length:156 start_codon:yes stop_codon:yes gene_type:complete
MDSKVISCIQHNIEWAEKRITKVEDMEDAVAISAEFYEWLEDEEIDLLYLS